MTAGVLSLDHVSKSFGPVRAVTDVTFEVRTGEVIALVGENGAGKSTLLKMLSGVHAPDAGRILIDGEAVAIASPARAARLGIAVIYQELSLIPWLSVAQNLFLGREREIGRVVLSKKRLHEKARAILSRLDADIDPGRPVATLGVAAQQMVEIARALSKNARFILMDEPTASLAAHETDVLFERIAALKRQGVGIVYISHRLEEIHRIADRIGVLRDGALVHTGPVGDKSIPEIVELMVGRPIGDHYPSRVPRPGAEVLRVEPAPGTDSKPVVVRAGEVVGIAGLVGAGRTEWLWRLFGASAGIGERVLLDGAPVVIDSPARARTLGIGMVPESRKEHGLVFGRSITDNATITILERLRSIGGLLDRRRQIETAEHFVKRLQVRCRDAFAAVDGLSGGNQQKVVLAKWLARDCSVLLLDEPTRGIDVGAKHEMYTLINELCAAGKAILLVSSDMPELIAMSDRIYVMAKGRFVAELPARDATQRDILLHASGLERNAA
jgi:ribose transport system ATP-binding protein